MTNFEKYKDDLMKIEGCFAFNKNTKKITRCDDSIICKDCLFEMEHPCENGKIKWLCEEYEEPILSDDELEFIKALNKATGKEWKYVLRTISNKILIFCNNSRTVMLSCDLANSLYYSNEDYIVIDENNKTLFKNIKFDDRIYDIKNKKFIKIK
jgi:hypothetical protein